MNRPALRIALALLATGRVAAPISAQQPLRVPADTVLEVRLATKVSTRTAQVGDVVEATLVRYRLPPSAPPIDLPQGSRVIGHVDVVRKGEPSKAAAKLRLSFTGVDGGTYVMSSRVLTIAGRHQVQGSDGDIPFGAGMGLLIGRSGKSAILGASAALLWMYLPPLFHSTNNPWADVELKPGDTLALHARTVVGS